MAGPSELSGVAPGIVPGKKAGDVSGAVEGAASTVTNMMKMIVQMQDHKQAAAAQKLDQMTRLIDAGLGPMVDVSQVPKLMKKMGVAVKKPEEMKTHLQQTDPSQPPTGAAASPQATTGAGADNTSKGVGAVNKAGFNKEQFKNAALQHWYDNAVAAAAKKGMTQQALAEYSSKVADLKNKAASDGPDAQNAIGKLMSLNEIPFSIDKAVWNNSTDKQKQGIINIAAGAETEKDFTARKERMGEALLTSGKFKDPEMAMRAGEALARGNSLPSDVKAAMTPNTFKDLGEEASLMGTLVELGVPTDKLATTAEAARVGGLQNALPTGLKPLAIQTMQTRQQQVQLEAGRLSVEAGKARADEAHWQSMAAAADARAKDEASKETLNTFKSLVEMKKAGIKVDDQVLNAAQEKFAKSMGLEVKEVNNFFHWLTGGTHSEFSPKAADVSGAVGQRPPNKESQPGTMDKIKKIMKSMSQDRETQ